MQKAFQARCLDGLVEIIGKRSCHMLRQYVLVNVIILMYQVYVNVVAIVAQAVVGLV